MLETNVITDAALLRHSRGYLDGRNGRRYADGIPPFSRAVITLDLTRRQLAEPTGFYRRGYFSGADDRSRRLTDAQSKALFAK
jgi:hypothetical protein